MVCNYAFCQKQIAEFALAETLLSGAFIRIRSHRRPLMLRTIVRFALQMCASSLSAVHTIPCTTASDDNEESCVSLEAKRANVADLV